MLVMILEKVPTSLRGALSRWLLEPKTGVFLGNPSARVRDELWNKAVKKSKENGAVLQVWTDQNPQGFSWRQHGERERTFIDLEGLFLVKIERNESSVITQNVDTENA
ncbi:MAG: type I-E CRISPR-associated endoribonuclease Cas2 [Dehalococcoidales bacterium]|nr:type I-E CRISPR-associated endoribonuclease Cas2 [Dehalococcoidales bacterium]